MKNDLATMLGNLTTFKLGKWDCLLRVGEYAKYFRISKWTSKSSKALEAEVVHFWRNSQPFVTPYIGIKHHNLVGHQIDLEIHLSILNIKISYWRRPKGSCVAPVCGYEMVDSIKDLEDKEVCETK